jgi:hypothetical protein
MTKVYNFGEKNNKNKMFESVMEVGGKNNAPVKTKETLCEKFQTFQSQTFLSIQILVNIKYIFSLNHL